MLALVYLNDGKPNLFRVRVDVTLVYLKDQLDGINQRINHKDTMKVNGVWYRRPSIDSVERLQFIQMMLKNDDDARNIFSTFELEVSLLRSPEDILKSLIMSDEGV